MASAWRDRNALSVICTAAWRKSRSIAATSNLRRTWIAWITWRRFRTDWATARPWKNCWAPKRRRARVVRTILTELQRIASHLLWLGTHALDIGALTPVFYCFREREEILKIFEKYCGARLTTHAFRIGGLQYETYDG